MSIWWYFATIVLSLGTLVILMTDINLLRGIVKVKEKTFVMNLPTLLLYVIAIAADIALLVFNRGFRVPWAILLGAMILSIFGLFVPLSPQGVISAGPLGCKLLPREEYSYEFAKDKLGECLKLYRKGADKPAVFHLGIKKMKTVKMLADWYGKHGYENPLTK